MKKVIVAKNIAAITPGSSEYVAAVKELRQLTGYGLKEAVTIVKALATGEQKQATIDAIPNDSPIISSFFAELVPATGTDSYSQSVVLLNTLLKEGNFAAVRELTYIIERLKRNEN